MPTTSTRSPTSQSRKPSKSSVVAPNDAVCTAWFPSGSGVRTHATTTSLCTSSPATRVNTLST